MNIKLMKYLDELLGPPICLVFHLYNSVRKQFVKPRYSPINKILLLKFFGMGSILMMAPMVKALKAKFPNATMSILTFSSNKEICELTGLFDNIYTIKENSLQSVFFDTLKNIILLRKSRFDICIDLEFFAKFSAIICYLIGRNIRVGYYLIQIGILIKMMWRGNLLTHEVYFNQHKHVTEAFLALSRALDADTDDRNYASLNVSRKAIDSVDRLLAYKSRDFLITININASKLCQERRWPKENFAQLITMLLATFKDTSFVLVGGKEDISYVESLTALFDKNINKDRVINLAGKLSISELTALLRESTLLISNDSGPLHMAVSLKIPTVSFFGPETPQRFGPKDGIHAILYREDIYCSPCLNVYNQKTAPCGEQNLCMRAIRVEEAYEKVIQSIQRNKPM